jgi:hypothetical protein
MLWLAFYDVYLVFLLFLFLLYYSINMYESWSYPAIKSGDTYL